MSAIVLAEQKAKLTAALQEYASSLSNLADEQVPQAFDMTDQLGKLAEEVRTRLRDRLLLWLNVNGRTVTDKGTKSADVGGFKVSAIPTRSGVDPKKLEALLRRRNIPPETAMDAYVSYKMNPVKLASAVASGKLTDADLSECGYDPSFRISMERLDG